MDEPGVNLKKWFLQPLLDCEGQRQASPLVGWCLGRRWQPASSKLWTIFSACEASLKPNAWNKDFNPSTSKAYILKAEKVAVMAILANKNWQKKCANLDKTTVATKVRKSWKWKELLTSCWNKASFLYCLLSILPIHGQELWQVVKIKPVYARIAET